MASTTEVPGASPTPVESGGIELLPLIEDPEAQAAASGSGIGDLRLADVGRGFARYRPVLLVAAAIVVMAAVLPGPEIIAGGGGDLWHTSEHDTLAGSGSVETEDDEAAAAAADQPLAPRASDSPGADFGGAGGGFASPSPSPSGGSGSPGGSPEPFAFTPPATEHPSSDELQGDDEVRIVAAGWATATAGTPLGGAGVPEGTLPVGKRAGRDDKRSFIRLSGAAPSLQLTVAEGTGANRLESQAEIVACPITDAAWVAEEGSSFDDAPAYDCDVSAAGVAGEDGTWTFDLTSLPEGAAEQGLALVPAPDAGLDFQVSFLVEES